MLISIPIEPVAKGRPRMTKTGHTYTPEKTRVYEEELKWRIKEAMGVWPMFLGGPLKLGVTFYVRKPKSGVNKYPCVKPDLDNFLKGLLDAANGIIWADDAQIVSLTAKKRYGDPRIELEAHIEDTLV